jgi:fatty-acyl-CoA synthase
MQSHLIRSHDEVRQISEGPYSAYMEHQHVYDALADCGQKYADRRAITFISDADLTVAAHSWTYAQFLEKVRRAANLFRSLVPGQQPRIGMLLPAIPEAYFTLWGGESVGVVCPINYLLDHTHIAELVQAANINILVALGPNPDLDIWSRVADIRALCPELQHVLAVGGAPNHADFSDALARTPETASGFEPGRSEHNLAALFHTGGTTGAPKLAQHTHRNQLHSAWSAAQMYAMDSSDVIINGFPMFHVAGAFVYGLSALLSGAEIVLPTMLGLRNSAFVAAYWKFVERHQVTLLAAVPTVIATLNNVERMNGQINTVRALLTGGSPLPNELAAAFEKKHAIPVRNILGMTECAGVVSIEPFLAERRPGSCGLALPFTEIRAVDLNGADCKPGESGILRLRGPNVGPGYTDPKKNAGTFEDGWLITGDIGHVDSEGRVFVTGRAKDVIIRGAHNIDPQVIEEALLQHPAVQMAAAVGEPDEYAGELPVAFVALKPAATVDLAQLAAFANARIPERPAYLKRIQIVESIPITAVGKVFKPTLRAMACERVLCERLLQAGLGGQVSVVVENASGGLLATFRPERGDVQSVRAHIEKIMNPFAVSFAFDDSSSLTAAENKP